MRITPKEPKMIYVCITESMVGYVPENYPCYFKAENENEALKIIKNHIEFEWDMLCDSYPESEKHNESWQGQMIEGLEQRIEFNVINRSGLYYTIESNLISEQTYKEHLDYV